MKSLYRIYESILDDVEITLNKGPHDFLIDLLFDKDDSTRQTGIETLYKTIKGDNPKQITSTNKIKMSDKYHIHFSDIRIGSHNDTVINNIILLKRNDDNYTLLLIIGIGRSTSYKPIIAYNDDLKNWNSVRSMIKPEDGELYEVPDSLTDLMIKLMNEANKYIK